MKFKGFLKSYMLSELIERNKKFKKVMKSVQFLKIRSCKIYGFIVLLKNCESCKNKYLKCHFLKVDISCMGRDNNLDTLYVLLLHKTCSWLGEGGNQAVIFFSF